MSHLESYLRQFYDGYRLTDSVPLAEHLCFHLNGNINLRLEERKMVKDLLGLTPHKKLPEFVPVAMMIDLVIVMLD